MKDFLRRVVSLPAQMLLGVGLLFALLARGVAWLLSPLLGRLGWQAPRWLAATSTTLRTRPVTIGAGVWSLIAIALPGWGGHHWYTTRPRPPEPQRVTFNVTPPPATHYELAVPQVSPLTIDFSASVAPLSLITEGITMSPALAGTWTWTNDHQLQFLPTADWPVGQDYAVRFDVAKTFAAEALLAEDSLAFSTVPFTATVASSEFYQDPQRAELKQVVVGLRFSHPVDSVDLAKRVSLAFDRNAAPSGPAPTFAISYDERHLQAWIRSQPVAVPAKDGSAEVKIEKGLRAAAGGTPTVAASGSFVGAPPAAARRPLSIFTSAVPSFAGTAIACERIHACRWRSS